jgi:hypothetical protein
MFHIDFTGMFMFYFHTKFYILAPMVMILKINTFLRNRLSISTFYRINYLDKSCIHFEGVLPHKIKQFSSLSGALRTAHATPAQPPVVMTGRLNGPSRAQPLSMLSCWSTAISYPLLPASRGASPCRGCTM